MNDLQRLGTGVELLQQLRELFCDMEDDGERCRAWDYLRDRFCEFENADMPAWEVIEADA